MSKAWTQKEIDWLIENYPEKGREFCAEYLDRSIASIRAKTSRLRLKQNHSSDFFSDWQKRAAESKIGKKRPAQADVLKKTHIEGKLIKNEQQCLDAGLRMKEWHKSNPHPKGMLGKKHTPETLAIISQTSKDKWKDPNYKGNGAEWKQACSDRMSAAQRKPGSKLRQGYSRGKQGKRSDLNDQYFRSSWEANYARYLNLLVKQGNIYKWEYEPDTFFFEEIKRGTRSYMPDFKIWETEKSEPYYIEVKGWMDDKSKTKLSRMNKYFPNIKIILIQKKEYIEIQYKLRALIPFWE